MANFFPRWTNLLPLKIAVCLIFVVAGLTAAFSYYATPKAQRVGYQPDQPIDYDHALHVDQLGMDCRYCHSSSEQKEHLNRGCFTPFDILGFKCSTGLLDPYNDSLDYVRYSQAFRKASVSDERLHPNRNLTAFSAPESNGLQGGGWFQSLTSMNLILTQAGAKRRHEIKPSADLADEE